MSKCASIVVWYCVHESSELSQKIWVKIFKFLVKFFENFILLNPRGDVKILRRVWQRSI